MSEQAQPIPFDCEIEQSGAWIKCLKCDQKSFNRNDILAFYCGYCHEFRHYPKTVFGEMCPCGQPLHYSDSNIERMIREQAEALGEHMKITVSGRTWMVPRHYIALHGVKAQDLLIGRYPLFKEVTEGKKD